MKAKILAFLLSLVVLVGILSLLPLPLRAAGQTAIFTIGSITYTVNGQQFSMDVAPYTKDGRTFVPVRYAAQAMGVTPENILYTGGKVILLKGNKVVQLTIGNYVMLKNGNAIIMDVAPEIVNGRTMIPFRWIAQTLDAGVDWNPERQQVVISFSDNQPGNQPIPLTQPSAQVPAAPTGLQLVTENCADYGGAVVKINLFWNPVENATAYKVYWYTWLPEIESWSGHLWTTVQGTRYVSEVIGDNTLYFYVTAINSVGESPPSQTVQIIALPPLRYHSGVKTVRNTYAWEYEGKQFCWTIEVPETTLKYEEAEKIVKFPLWILFQQGNPLTWLGSLALTGSPFKVPIDILTTMLVRDKTSSEYIGYVADRLNQAAISQGYDTFHRAEFIAAFVQSIPYKIVPSNTEYPPQVIANGGDCINKSVLLAAILKKLSYPVVILGFWGHAAVGVGFSSDQIPPDRAGSGLCYYPYQGVNYYFVETTATGCKIGESTVSDNEKPTFYEIL
ncbi:stalk domain-containing protein [Moorella naiadis]|uniref:copper amine oxidase N-terminal domain-containing protein n=1 Tax=Moorella naiadis (nom. illeg.) TaxID=3093670 RepID=UPI003D9C7FA8